MSLLHTAVGVFTIANPVGNLPIYLSFTTGNSREDRAIARSAAFTFIVALLLSTWVGNNLLEFFGISRGAFQIAGGVIVVLIGLSMLRSQAPPEHHDPASVARDQSSSIKGVVPLGIPLLAGPGTLTVVIADPLAASLSGRMGISFVVLVLGLVVYLIFAAGDRIASQISSSALQVLTKVMGLLLTAIAIQMLINGLVSVFPSLSQAASGKSGMLRLAQQLSRVPIVGFMVKSGIIDERNLDEFPLQYMLRSGNKVGPQPVLGVNMQIARGMVGINWRNAMTSSAKLVPTAWLLAWNQVFAPSRYFGPAVLNRLFVACVDLIGAAGSSRCCRGHGSSSAMDRPRLGCDSGCNGLSLNGSDFVIFVPSRKKMAGQFLSEAAEGQNLCGSLLLVEILVYWGISGCNDVSTLYDQWLALSLGAIALTASLCHALIAC